LLQKGDTSRVIGISGLGATAGFFTAWTVMNLVEASRKSRLIKIDNEIKSLTDNLQLGFSPLQQKMAISYSVGF